MRRFFVTLAILLLVQTASGQEFRHSIGVGTGLVTISPGNGYDFNKRLFLGGSLGNRLSDHWLFFIDGSYGRLFTTTTPFPLASGQSANFKALRIVGTLNYRIFSLGSRMNTYLGAGGGLLSWKVVEPHGDTTYKVPGVRSPSVDFEASELIASSAVRFMIQPSRLTLINLTVSGDYLTGAGAEFDKSVDEGRGRWLYGATISLNLLLGTSSKEKWRSDEAWKAKAGVPTKRLVTTALDSDGDGVPDEADKCPNTPRGAVVDATGCSIDSDGDGVPDGLDDCPDTPRSARGYVDVHGCPVDNDFDGIPDFRDSCATTPVGAQVDSTGCPIDSDGDGVPDGLDDCPHTLKGIPVDKYGCTDVAIFARPMILNIDYDPGGFEVDPKNKAKLQQLAQILKIVPDYKLEINAYTDDIGTDVANQKLSEKRALRVREYLVIYGVAPDRIKAVGRGESNYLASNETAEGRARNRRIEILFYK